MILLIRHGEYKRWDTEDPSLTKCGIEQANSTAKALRHMKGLPIINQILSSTLRRARETANIIGGKVGVGVTEDYDLVEGDPCQPQHRQRFERVFSKYLTHTSTHGPLTDVIVCHGNIIRYLLCRQVTNFDH